MSEAERKSIFFVQVSDSHIGFSKEANKDVTATLQEAVDKINALPQNPALVLHTGDITQLAKAERVRHCERGARAASRPIACSTSPASTTSRRTMASSYLKRYGKGTQGGGWHSFDHSGVHFIGLVNVLNLKAGGLGTLGAEQIAWLKKDVQHVAAARRSWCSRTCRCGPSTRNGDGGRTIRSRRSDCSSGSDR